MQSTLEAFKAMMALSRLFSVFLIFLVPAMFYADLCPNRMTTGSSRNLCPPLSPMHPETIPIGKRSGDPAAQVSSK